MLTTFAPMSASERTHISYHMHHEHDLHNHLHQQQRAHDALALEMVDALMRKAPVRARHITSQSTPHYHPYDFTQQSVASTSSSSPSFPFLRELFISPHPDDICYSAFGTAVQNEGTSNNANNGRMIVTVFSQSRCANGHLGEKLNRHVGNITDIRKEEDEQFASSVKCKLVQLGMSDSSARDEFSRKEELAKETKAAQVAATKAHPTYAKVEKNLGDIVRWAIKCKAAIYMPIGIGCHIDHLMTRVAAESIMEAVRKESITATLPSRVTYYEDLPYAFYQTEETIEQMTKTVVVSADRKPRQQLVTLDKQLWARKTKAVEGYATQMKPTIIPSLLSRATLLGSDEVQKDGDEPALRERTWILEPGQWVAGF